MEIKTENKENTAILNLNGELDYNSYKDFNAMVLDLIEKKKASKIVIGMSGLIHIDSMGLGTITKLWKTADQDEIEFALAEVPKNVANMIKLVNLDKRIKVFESVDDALA